MLVLSRNTEPLSHTSGIREAPRLFLVFLSPAMRQLLMIQLTLALKNDKIGMTHCKTQMEQDCQQKAFNSLFLYPNRWSQTPAGEIYPENKYS